MYYVVDVDGRYFSSKRFGPFYGEMSFTRDPLRARIYSKKKKKDAEKLASAIRFRIGMAKKSKGKEYRKLIKLFGKINIRVQVLQVEASIRFYEDGPPS